MGLSRPSTVVPGKDIWPQQINFMDDGFAAPISHFSLKHNFNFFFFHFAASFLFGDTNFFFLPENHIIITFLSSKEKNLLLRSPYFCGKSVFFSAENPSSIKLIWCGLWYNFFPTKKLAEAQKWYLTDTSFHFVQINSNNPKLKNNKIYLLKLNKKRQNMI